MSRRGLADFIHSIEHSASLIRKARQCSEPTDLIKLAADYGFPISLKDLEDDEECDRISNWFQTSKLSPFKQGIRRQN